MQGAVPYSPSIATKDEEAHSGVHFYDFHHPDLHYEAQHLVTLIQKLQSTNPHDTMAILVRSRHHLPHIMHALQHAHMAYTALDLQKLVGGVLEHGFRSQFLSG